MIVQGIKYRCRVAIVQSVRVADAMILSAQRGPSQGMDIGIAVIADDAGRSRRGRRFGANGTLLALKIVHISSLYISDIQYKRYIVQEEFNCCVNLLDEIILLI